MNIPDSHVDLGAESAEDLQVSTAALEARLTALRELKREIAVEISEQRRLRLGLDEAELLIRLERFDEAHAIARPIIEEAVREKLWEHAVEACDLVFSCGSEDALAALGQGVWLAVTFPIDPELTLGALRRIVEETPDDADGAAVAAATAAYVVDLRTEDPARRRDLEFLSMQLLGEVSRRHGNVTNQAEFDEWSRRLELDDPDKFLVRLRNVVDVLVQDDWWFDRERLQQELPLH